eukprot:7104659-Alexandrium_andersonii.AAC.1
MATLCFTMFGCVDCLAKRVQHAAHLPESSTVSNDIGNELPDLSLPRAPSTHNVRPPPFKLQKQCVLCCCHCFVMGTVPRISG